MGYAPKTSTPVVPTTIINACAACPQDAVQSALCDALAAHAAWWCQQGSRRPQFATGFFQRLRAADPSSNLFNGLREEAPMVFQQTAGGAGSSFMGVFGAGLTDPSAAASGLPVQQLENMNGGNFLSRIDMARTLPSDQYARYADGAMPNPNGAPGSTIIEVKGPTDSFRQNQGRDYQNIPAPHNVKVASCETCPGACPNGGGCPP